MVADLEETEQGERDDLYDEYLDQRSPESGFGGLRGELRVCHL